MRIVQLANFVTATSGGIRTVLDRLGCGYRASGHDVHRILPAATSAIEISPVGVTHHLPGWRLPGRSGYRLLVDRDPVRGLLEDLAPDRIEVHDRFSLTWVVGWARARELPCVLVVHERLAAVLRTWTGLGPAAGAVADVADHRLAVSADRLVVPSRWAARAFRSPATVEVVPLGVDLATFRPPARPADTAVSRDAPRRVDLVAVGRLSREKRPDIAVETLRDLLARGVDARLHLVGTGPLRSRLERRTVGLPVTFHGFVGDRAALARLLGDADVAVATSGVETFGLAALEALACGTPVVATRGGAVAELLSEGAGQVVAPRGDAMADGVLELLAAAPASRRAAARRRAETHPWERTVARMLQVHDLPAADLRRHLP